MEPGEDAYQVLGVTETATEVEIKKAYRKLALEHHPDRQRDNPTAAHHHVFAKISNAYEILSNPQKRKDYDQARRYGMHYQDHVDEDDADQRHYPQHAADFHDFFSDLHDPFEVFERVFRQEFGHHYNVGGRGGTRPRGSSGVGRSPFDGPFFASSPFGESLFGQDPFFSPARDMMMMMNPGGFGPSGMGGANVITSMSSSSFGGMGGGGSSVSTSTTTRIVNGKRETVTERVVRHPDGRVERHVESSDGNYNNNNGSNGPARLADNHGSSRRPLLSGQTRPRSATNNRSSGRSSKKPHVVDLTGNDDVYDTGNRKTTNKETKNQRAKKPLKFW